MLSKLQTDRAFAEYDDGGASSEAYFYGDRVVLYQKMGVIANLKSRIYKHHGLLYSRSYALAKYKKFVRLEVARLDRVDDEAWKVIEQERELLDYSYIRVTSLYIRDIGELTIREIASREADYPTFAPVFKALIGLRDREYLTWDVRNRPDNFGYDANTGKYVAIDPLYDGFLKRARW